MTTEAPTTETRTKPTKTPGGGFIVLRRRGSKGVLNSANAPWEHPSAEAAFAEANRLADLHRGARFVIFQQLGDEVTAPAIEGEKVGP